MANPVQTSSNQARDSGVTDDGTPREVPPPRRQVAMVGRIPEFGALIVLLVAISAFFTVKSPDFLNWDNWLNILTAIAVTGIIAAPGTLLMVSGNLDLSVGSGAALCGVIVAVVGGTHHDLVLGIVLALLAGVAIGVFNGFLVTVVGVSSLITTLGGLAVFRGFCEVIAGGQTVVINNFSGLGTDRLPFNIPLAVLILVGAVLVFWVAMRYTTYGRSMYAIGANPVAARLVGIRTKRAIFWGFVLSGLCFAIGGLILTSQLSAASPQAATGLELSVVTAIVLGGSSLTGGRGSVIGTFVGLLIIGVLNDGLILLNVNSYWQDVAQGALLIFAVSVDRLRVILAAP
jgi:ribose transport system permease protein